MYIGGLVFFSSVVLVEVDMFTDDDDDIPNERFILDDANANVGEATRFIG